ncbi:MAG: hypothetical protein V2I33_18185 [Kangiellaceae bacterium]|jgi:colicin import membrane protein|nr:hypothetical protein [Kangiellaceae bacterium]
METRQRNAEIARKREEAALAKAEEEKIRNYNNRVAKEQSRENQRSTRATLMQKLKSEVSALKRNKQENRDIIQEQKEDQLARNTAINQAIKNQKREAEERRRQEAEEKQLKAQMELETKIEEELRVKEQREADIARMEQEELELIQRLQNT